MKITWDEADIESGLRINNNPLARSPCREFPNITQDSIISNVDNGAIWIIVHLVTGASESFRSRADLAEYLNRRSYFPYIETAGETRLPKFEGS